MIPKVVYQTWHSGEDVPIQYQEIMQHNKKMNPGYRFVLLDDVELNRFFRMNHEIPKDVKKLFFNVNPHYGPARADIFRYVVVYLFGGIYLDIKIRCLVPFDDWILATDEYIFSYWEEFFYQKNVIKNKNGEMQNWFIISKPRHEFLWQILLHLSMLARRDLKFFYGKKDVLATTGPIMCTQIFEAGDFDGRRIDSRLYLDYGDTFTGIDKYIHYSRLIEPIFMASKKTIPICVYLNQPLQVGLNIYCHGYYIMSELEDLVMNCDCVYAFDDRQRLVFMAVSGSEIILQPHNFNRERIYYRDGYCFKQALIDEEDRLVFHFQKFIKLKF